MSKLVSQRTAGRLSIKVLPQSTQGSEKFTVEQVRNSTLDMARVNVSPLHDIAAPIVVPSLPYLFKSTAHMRRVLDGPIGDEILSSIEAHGFIGLCFYDSGFRSFFSVKKPITTAADVKGMRVRVMKAEMWTDTVRALGGTPIVEPFDRIHASLKAGVVDAAELNWSSYVATRSYEVAPIYSLTEHSASPEILLFSKRVWDGLPKEDQEIIRSAAKESVPYMRELWDQREASARKTIEAAGLRVVTDVDKKSFSDAMAIVYSTLAADPHLQDLVARIGADPNP
jgi:tripartite ATP-independent transporter DctP family solute receptor